MWVFTALTRRHHCCTHSSPLQVARHQPIVQDILLCSTPYLVQDSRNDLLNFLQLSRHLIPLLRCHIGTSDSSWFSVPLRCCASTAELSVAKVLSSLHHHQPGNSCVGICRTLTSHSWCCSVQEAGPARRQGARRRQDLRRVRHAAAGQARQDLRRVHVQQRAGHAGGARPPPSLRMPACFLNWGVCCASLCPLPFRTLLTTC